MPLMIMNAVRADSVVEALQTEPSPFSGRPIHSSANEPTHGISPASSDTPTERASGPAFEHRVRTLLHSRTDRCRQRNAVESQWTGSWGGIQRLETISSVWESTMDVINNAGPMVLPSEDESSRLLNLFLSYMGVSQHFFDLRTFIDSMTLMFQSEVARRHQTETMWYVQYLLVMAMGKLMDVDTQDFKPFPGSRFFAEAMRILPPLYRLGEYGVISVEILCLAGTYLQWCDRKHDAYLYIGTAIRLAEALECSLPYSEHHCLPSLRYHKNRVWWTVFMLDRRVSAGLGLPPAIDDRQLTAELPTSAPGFPPPEPLVINIKIAQATGNIMNSLYGNAPVSQVELVQNVRSILSNLYETGHSIPLEYTIDFKGGNVKVTRTGASLYLMLFQAIILCIRPILLQRVKDKVTAAPSRSSLLDTSPVLDRLCSTCGESATKSVQILHALKNMGQIARFGYFDLDATFSAALTLVMIGFVDEIAFSKVPDTIQQAIEVLEYLSHAGNSAAEQRLNEIRQFCSYVWSDRSASDPATTSGAPVTTNEAARNVDRADIARMSPIQEPVLQEQDTIGSSLASNNNQQDGDEVAAGPNSSATLTNFEGNYFDLDLNRDADGIYLSFNDPHLPLTGIDQLDWAEMDRVFTTTSRIQ